MKKLKYIIGTAIVFAFASCSDVKREPGRVYMPDMAYSRAYETYAERPDSTFTQDSNGWDANGKQKIFYNNLPVAGTVNRSQDYVYHIEKDKIGDSSNYVASKQIMNPVPVLDSADLKEAGRLYLINCGICHGTKLDGNGPLYNGGSGPFPAAPKNLVTLNMPDGQMYYSITYGKNVMGSYASQLTPTQRWKVIHFIRSKQAEAAPKTNVATRPTTKDNVKANP